MIEELILMATLPTSLPGSGLADPVNREARYGVAGRAGWSRWS